MSWIFFATRSAGEQWDVLSCPLSVDFATLTTTSQSNYLVELKLASANTEMMYKACDVLRLHKLLIVPRLFPTNNP